jgi:Zn-dependent peptidase ImmA (M78 family)/transcriptional regulator with XRE-family HTH domain
MLGCRYVATYGQTLAERRQRFGFSTDEVAQLSGLSSEELSAIESGSRRLTMLELEALGRALVFDPAALLRGESLPDARRLPGWFRSHTPDSSEAIPAGDVRLMALAAELGEIGAFLQGAVGQPTLSLATLRSPAPLEDHEHAWQGGYELGTRAREKLYELDPSMPAGEPLRSVQHTFERLGIHVAHVAMHSWSRQAVSIWRPEAMPVVLLNVCSPRAQLRLPRRQVMAHELPHLLHDSGETDMSPTERRPQPHAEAVEQRANAFAPAFIAPPAYVRERIAKHTTAKEMILQIARDWGFTLEGAVWHAKNIGLVEAEVAEALLADVAWRSRSARIPGNWEPELPRDDPRDHGLDVETSPLVGGLLQDLVLQAYRNGSISAGRAREILTIA